MSLFSYLKSQVSILDVVGRYVTLRPAGTYHKGSCPFHKETDASFTVSPDKQIFYCFGCQAGGDVIAFLAKVENCNQWDAAQLLISQYNIAIPDSVSKEAAVMAEQARDRKSYFAVCSFVAQWAHEQLRLDARAKAYVAARAISNESVMRYQIGYLPGGSAAMTQLVKAAAKENILAKDLIATGFLFDSTTSLRSPFEYRILFPITDALGRHCAFGGRIFIESDTRAKYYNSRESEFFQKGKLLFGFDLAKKSMQEKKHVFLVEGYVDCVAMAQHGYPATVATLGTACTLDHLQQLSRFVEVVYVVYDGDAAGRKAMLRMAQLCWQVNLELRVVVLEGKEDPASFLSKGGDFALALDRAQDIFSFYVRSLVAQFEEKTLAQKMHAVDDIVDLIGKIPDMVKQEFLLQDASRAMRLPIELLRMRVRGGAENLSDSSKELEDSEVAVKSVDTGIEDHFVAGCIWQACNGGAFKAPKEVCESLPAPVRSVLTTLDAIAAQQPPAAVFEALQMALEPALREYVVRVCMQYGTEISHEECVRLLDRIVQQSWKEMIRTLRVRMQEASERGDTEQVAQLLRVFGELKAGMQKRGILS